MPDEEWTPGEPRIAIISVPHSGTTTSQQFLNVLEVPHRVAHTQDNSLDDIARWNAAGCRFIIPVRDPRLVYESYWQRKGRRTEPRRLKHCYDCMDTVCGRVTYLTLPIDRPISPDYWIKLQMFLNLSDDWANSDVLSFIHEWKKYGSIGEYKEPPPTEYPDWLEEERTRWGYTLLKPESVPIEGPILPKDNIC